MSFRVKSFSHRQAIAASALSLFLVSPTAAVAISGEQWVTSWATSQQVVEPQNMLPPSARTNTTLRQLVRLSDGGSRVRVLLSNAFGRSPLTIDDAAISVAVSPPSAKIDPKSSHLLTFGGDRSVIIPAGAEYLSDPVRMRIPALTTVAVSVHFAEMPDVETGHPGSRATSYAAPGDQAEAADLQNAIPIEHWYLLSGIDVDRPVAAVAALGDSITDGHGVKTDSNARWTDTLLERIKAARATRSLAVLNLGIGGNRMVDDGLGPNAAARLDRDVLAREGIRYLILLEGVNDLGVLTRDKPATPEQHAAMVKRIITAYRQIITRGHQHRIKMIGATIMPFAGSDYYHPGAATEADRQAINTWIRGRGHFDALVDFDALLRDPERPDRLRKDYDSGDGLHPSAAGYRAMGEAVPLSLFAGDRR